MNAVAIARQARLTRLNVARVPRWRHPTRTVIPANAGTQAIEAKRCPCLFPGAWSAWVPAFAGMTGLGGGP